MKYSSLSEENDDQPAHLRALVVWCCLNKPTSNQAGGKGTSALHVSAARGDRHQPRQDAAAQGAHIVLVRDDIAQQKHGDAPSGCS